MSQSWSSSSEIAVKKNCLFSRPFVKLAYRGTESLLFLGPKIWDILPDIYKDIPELNSPSL